MGLDEAASLPIKGLTAQELMDYIVEKIEAIRKVTGGSGVGTRLPVCSGSIVVTTLDCGPGGSWFESRVGVNIL